MCKLSHCTSSKTDIVWNDRIGNVTATVRGVLGLPMAPNAPWTISRGNLLKVQYKLYTKCENFMQRNDVISFTASLV